MKCFGDAGERAPGLLGEGSGIGMDKVYDLAARLETFLQTQVGSPVRVTELEPMADGRVVDRCLQILGSIGIKRDTVVERIYRDIRPFRIYDGSSEVHRHALANRILSRGPFASDHNGQFRA
jgi:hypothetical protein